MRFPLDNWTKLKTGYRYGQKTSYSDFHLGIDKSAPEGTPIYAPTSGRVSQTIGQQGGNTVHLTDSTGKLWRFLHLSRFAPTVGQVAEGALLGYVGTTGLSTGPHLHLDIWKGGAITLQPKDTIDPESYINSHTNNLAMIIEGLSRDQKKKLQDFIDGKVVLGFNTKTGQTYVIRDSKKKALPLDEALANILAVGRPADILDQIPNA